jgi:integrase
MSRRRGHNEGTIYERRDKDGRVFGYQSQLTLPGGKRRSFSGKTKRDVQQKLNESRSALLHGRLTASRGQTLEVYLNGWLETVRHSIKPRTYEVYALNARRVGTHIGHVRLDALAPARVQYCYNALLAGGLSARTVQQAHMVLHKALADAMRMDLVVRHVTEGTSVPRPHRKEMETLSCGQLSQLFEATRSDRFAALWVLLGTSGLRIGEALGLKWVDIDFAARTLIVRRALQRHEDGGLVFVEPKSKQSRRTVQLSSLACAALREHRERQAFERKTAEGEWHDHNLVFCTAFGTPLDRGLIHLNWIPALKKADLRRIRLHDLRHTAATLMLQEGVHPKVVQEMLGHSSISVTLDIYSHVAPSLHHEAADRMDAILGRQSNA